MERHKRKQEMYNIQIMDTLKLSFYFFEKKKFRHETSIDALSQITFLFNVSCVVKYSSANRQYLFSTESHRRCFFFPIPGREMINFTHSSVDEHWERSSTSCRF